MQGRPELQETLLILRRTQRTDAGKTTAIRPGSHSSLLELSKGRKTNSPKSPSTGGWVGATLSTRLLAVSGVGQPLVLECQKQTGARLLFWQILNNLSLVITSLL